MTAPIVPSTKIQQFYKSTGPTTKLRVWYRRSQGYKQKYPYTVDTACNVKTYVWKSGSISADSWAASPETNPAWVEAQNKARGRFVGKLGNASSFGATLTAEARRTTELVGGSVIKIVTSAKALLRGDILKAASILNFHPDIRREVRTVRKRAVRSVLYDNYTNQTFRGQKRYVSKKVYREVFYLPNGKKFIKNSGSVWLWWSYGVKPLMQDLYNAADVLQRPQPSERISGGGSGSRRDFYGNSYQSDTYVTKVGCKVSAEVRVKNPNLWLANQMGLVNPLMWINEAVPLSFVLDWFSNWSQVLSQYTDFVGLDIARPITTTVGVMNLESKLQGRITNSRERTTFQRQLSIPSVKLKFAYERFQWQRGANAISLLVQMLDHKR